MVRTNHNTLAWVGGVVYTHENFESTDQSADQNIEALLGVQYKMFRFDRYNLQSQLLVYPGLTDAGRVRATAHLGELVDVDLVIESVVEDLAAKRALFSELDSVCKPETILATNTSTLPVVEMAMATGRPDLVCGIHFFNPAPAMALVEVVRPITASDATIAAAVSFASACGKDPVEVKDQAGFIVNALLFPYLNNAVRLLEQGVATKEGIDAAMKGGCGFPMGPFALLDLVGLDTSLAILDALYDEFKDPNYAAMPLLRRMVAAEQLGRKSGRGFLDYRK